MFLYPERDFSTATVSEAKRLAAWQEIVSDVFFKVQIDGVASDRWGASIEEVRLRDFTLSAYATGNARGTRSRAAISGDTEEYYIAVFPTHGSMYYYQYSRNGIVRNGEYVLLSSGDFYQLSCNEPFRGVLFKVPAPLLDRHYENVRLHCGGVRPPNTVLGGVTLSFIRSVGTLTTGEREIYGPGLQRQLLSLLALMFQTEPTAEGPQTLALARLYERVRSYVGNRFQDEDLSPKRAATELGVSVGYLHRSLQANGTSFRRLLRDVRLAHAYEALNDPGTSRRRISDVAYAVGFSDHSLFSRTFKHRFGMAPRDCIDTA